jgi:hypothetical protein
MALAIGAVTIFLLFILLIPRLLDCHKICQLREAFFCVYCYSIVFDDTFLFKYRDDQFDCETKADKNCRHDRDS